MQCAVILLLIIAIKTRRSIKKGAAKSIFVPLGIVFLGHPQCGAQFVFAFKRADIGREEIIVGVVGVLQFEVLEHRLKHEYGVDIRMEQLAFRCVRWVVECPQGVEALRLTSTTRRALDRVGRDVLLFENEWSVQWALDNNDGLVLAETADRGKADEME